MKIQIDSHIKLRKDAIFFEKEYFCIWEKDCSFGFVTKSEMICKDSNSTDYFPKDSFVPPVYDQSRDNHESSFIPPMNNNTDERKEVSEKGSVNDAQKVLLLFVKADSGNSIITDLRSEMKLSSKYSDDLYLETMNIWVGTERIFEEKFVSDFSLVESKGDIPKLDFVIMQVKLPNNIKGYQAEANSIERMDFFKLICEKELPIIRFSNRLNFNNSKGASLSWEK